MKFASYLKHMHETGTMAGGPAVGASSGDMTVGGDVALFTNRLIAGASRRQWPSMLDDKKKKRKKQ